MFYNTETLLTAAKNSEFFPTGQSTFTDDMLTEYANQEQQSRIVPAILSVRQQFFKATSQTSIIANKRYYTIPERAIGTTFRTLFFLPNATDIDTKYRMTKYDSEDTQGTAISGVAPYGYDLTGDEVALLPKPSASQGALLFSYYRRPSQLVATSSCAKITGISVVGATASFTVDTDLTASLSVGSKVDFISSKAPFLSWADDAVITAITSTTIAVATSSVQDESGTTEPIVTDYICPAQFTNIPQISMEYHTILSELVAWRAIKASGAQQNLGPCSANIKDMLDKAAQVIENRVETSPDLIYEPNGLMGALSGRNYRSFI